MKDAISAHAEFAENVLPRLKRTYIKKCQEVEVRPARGYRTAMARLTLSGSCAFVRFRSTSPQLLQPTLRRRLRLPKIRTIQSLYPSLFPN